MGITNQLQFYVDLPEKKIKTLNPKGELGRLPAEQKIKILNPKGESGRLPVSEKKPHHILVVDRTPTLFNSMQAIASVKDIQLQQVATLKDSWRLLSSWQPDVILVNLTCAGPELDTDDDEMLFGNQILPFDSTIPAIILAPPLSFQQRIRLSQPGIHGILQQPILPGEILDRAIGIIHRTHAWNADVLIVSEENGLLDHLRRVFMFRGLQPQLINQASELWAMLEQNSPHLLMIDMDSLSINALALCRVIRCDPHWGDLPIILLSGQADRFTLQQVFAAGADDYVQKPLFEPELITRVFNRLERSRLLHELADTDNLTRLANRRKATTDIKRLISLAERQEQHLCFVIFDIDHFKQINDQYGHAVGDQILHHTGTGLKQMFRQSDVLARWGGDEFVLGLFDVCQGQCAKRMNQLMQRLQVQTVNHAASSVAVTYSVGIAEYPMAGYSLDELYPAADQALYRAKQGGRNQVCFA